MFRYGCRTAWFLLIAAFGACGTDRAASDDSGPPMVVGNGQSGYFVPMQQERPEDLTLANFFSAGWDDEWAKQVRATGTPNMALLRVQTNFMEREFRANYYLQDNVASKTTKNLTDDGVGVGVAEDMADVQRSRDRGRRRVDGEDLARAAHGGRSGRSPPPPSAPTRSPRDPRGRASRGWRAARAPGARGGRPWSQ